MYRKVLIKFTRKDQYFHLFSEIKSLKKLLISSLGLLKLIHVFWMLMLDGEILTWNMIMRKPPNKHRRTF